jgi:protein-S-isoprenylcysteine O-methyltransferase Ste14
MTQLEKKINREHRNLAGEHPRGDLGQIVLFVLFMVVWIADSFFLKLTDLSEHYLPFYLKTALAVIILAAGIYLSKRAHDTLFNSERGENEVIREGPFARTRHPLYLSTMLFYIALLVFSPTILGLLLFAVIFGFYNYISAYEEKILLEKFGDKYREYMKAVPRWFPRLK